MSFLSEKERKASAQREANARALARGEPLPFPNVWDALDPTKVDGEPTREALLESVAAFRTLWREQMNSL